MPMDLQREKPDEIQVLLIDLSKRFGGASVRALTLASHLQPGTAAIAGLENSPVVNIANQRNIPVKIVGKTRMDPLIPFRLARVIRRHGVQIIDTQNIQSKFWGSLAASITDVAFVSTLNSAYEDEQGRTLKGKFYALLDRWTNFRTDRYIAVSDAIRKGLLKAGISDAMVDLVTNAVETGEAAPGEDPALIREQIGLPADAFVCVSVGRLVWAKGHEDLIAAFAAVAKQVPNAYALILGDGVLYPDLMRHIIDARLEDRCILLGHCEPQQVLRILKASDVFVLSSRSEGVPFALLEAASAGLPIVATRCGGVPDVLTDGVEALLVAVGDVQAIAAGILALYHNRERAQKLGAQAREKITRDYGVQKQVEATQSAYQKALAHKRV